MNKDEEQAKRYREHALDLRETAHSAPDGKSKDILVQLANTYEQMANMLDDIALTDRKLAARK